MQHFDLGPIAEKIVNNLSKSEFRRLLIAMHLIRDPILIIIDDLLKDLDALSAFQVMSSLQDYCKKQARMALVSMRCPRSDIYQLLTQVTLMFYGEVIYSGLTKQMPHYFNNIGFKCPTSENPAVYYLSLASVDRETPESYAETQMKAMKLVEIFKERRDSLALLNPLINNIPAEMPILSCFYGSPSGTIKFIALFSRLLAYVSHSGSIGFKCPTNENPAVYYLSLASVDRETPESYAETQMKAMKLVEIFKERRDSLALLNPLVNNIPAEMPILSCFYGSPSGTIKFIALFSRLLAYVSHSGSFIFGQCFLPLFILTIAIFGSSMNNRSFHAPKSLAGTIFCMVLYTALSAVWATVIQFKDLRKTMFFETSLNLYNATLMLIVYLFFGAILDILSVGLASFAMVWKITNDVQLDEFFSFFVVIWCVYYFYKLFTLATFILFQSTQKMILFGTTFAIFMSIIASGFLKSYQTFISASKYLLLTTFTSIERYGNQKLAHDFVNNTRVLNCNRNEFREFNESTDFCRWKTGKDYLSEIYPENILIPEWWIGLLLIFSLNCFVGVIFLLVSQKCSQKKLLNLK
uniref:ABC transporter domain-containing protein n=1 Tax=Panagrolaimus sp. JU765 TaxID=591449 RepID=A0AC34RQU1_9BILA